MKNSDESRSFDKPQLIVTDLEKRRIGDKFSDRSGIKMWEYKDELKLWMVKRN